jgi:hypothetical protein
LIRADSPSLFGFSRGVSVVSPRYAPSLPGRRASATPSDIPIIRRRLFSLGAPHCIAVLVDVRSRPYSRYASRLNREAIGLVLREPALEFLFLGDRLE